MNKKLLTVLIAMVFLFTSACSGASSVSAATETYPSENNTETADATVQPTAVPIEVNYDENLEVDLQNDEQTNVQLNGSEIVINGIGAAAQGSVLTITSGGMYNISGQLLDGQIIVDSQDDEKVYLLLNGVGITCSNSAPIYVKNADETIIYLMEGTQNVLSDGSEYVLDAEEEPTAVLFSKDDLTITGEGALTVNANYKHGIVSNDDLLITGGTIVVNAVKDGLKGTDSVVVNTDSISINAGGDGVQANNSKDASKGFILIEAGSIDINAGMDGLQAETSILITGGEFNIITGGGSVASSGSDNRFADNSSNSSEESAKAIKAGLDVTISGGTFQISALDDAFHTDGTITIEGGTFSAASGDDGIHAETALTINGGTLDITQSLEGIESQLITINGGVVRIFSSDDGLNAVSSSSGSNEHSDDGSWFIINDGYVYINAGGDGLDSNGSGEINGGMVIVEGPEDSRNGPLDYMGSLNINGGFVLVIGSAGMAQAPSESSAQYSLYQAFSSTMSAGTLIHIEDISAETVLDYVPSKTWQTMIFSSPELQNGGTYTISLGGSNSGTAVDGLITDGSYSGGTQATSLIISSMVTGAETASQGMSGSGKPQRP